MRHLPKPQIGVSTESIYQMCVDSFQDASYKKKLHSCDALIKKDSVSYEEKVPLKVDEFLPSVLPIGVTDEDLKKVYTQKFAKKNGVGRPYYDKILSAAPNGICPICGVQQVRNLDHYLPKSQFPLLVVTPMNLIPTCRDCNFDKLAFSTQNPKEAPLHPYFDNIMDDIWLDVEVFEDVSVVYRANCPERWSNVLKSRVENHLNTSNLRELYGCHAIQEISNSLLLWKKIYARGQTTALFQYLCDVKESAEDRELNSWKSALYRGIVRQFEIIKIWIAA